MNSFYFLAYWAVTGFLFHLQQAYRVVLHVSIYLQLLWILDSDVAVALSSFVSRVKACAAPVSLLSFFLPCGFLLIIFRVQCL